MAHPVTWLGGELFDPMGAMLLELQPKHLSQKWLRTFDWFVGEPVGARGSGPWAMESRKDKGLGSMGQWNGPGDAWVPWEWTRGCLENRGAGDRGPVCADGWGEVVWAIPNPRQ